MGDLVPFPARPEPNEQVTGMAPVNGVMMLTITDWSGMGKPEVVVAAPAGYEGVVVSRVAPQAPGEDKVLPGHSEAHTAPDSGSYVHTHGFFGVRLRPRPRPTLRLVPPPDGG